MKKAMILIMFLVSLISAQDAINVWKVTFDHRVDGYNNSTVLLFDKKPIVNNVGAIEGKDYKGLIWYITPPFNMVYCQIKKWNLKSYGY